jgi:hypothetical protein
MELKDIVMIAGQPGLYKVAGQRKNGLIVEALDGSQKKIATSPTQRISVLIDIAIFTDEEEIRLADVLLQIKKETEKGMLVPDKKGTEDDFKNFLATVVPNYDRERVYLSDIKKLASWWHILQDKLDFEALTQKESEEKTEGDAATVEKKAVSKSAKSAPKNVAPKIDTKGKGAKAVNTPRKTQ